MDNIELLNEVDTALGKSVQGSRQVHVQIQNVIRHFEQQLKTKSGEVPEGIVNRKTKSEEN